MELISVEEALKDSREKLQEYIEKIKKDQDDISWCVRNIVGVQAHITILESKLKGGTK
jgi:hypothetical protein